MADFQIGSSVRMLLAMQDAGGVAVGRPAEAFARRVLPDYPDIPAALPAAWLPAHWQLMQMSVARDSSQGA